MGPGDQARCSVQSAIDLILRTAVAKICIAVLKTLNFPLQNTIVSCVQKTARHHYTCTYSNLPIMHSIL